MTGSIRLEGSVRGKSPFITKIGNQDVEIGMGGSMILCKQKDQPGMIGSVGSLLAKENINISFMTVGRDAPRSAAIMAIGVDDPVSAEVLRKISEVPGVQEATYIAL